MLFHLVFIFIVIIHVHIASYCYSVYLSRLAFTGTLNLPTHFRSSHFQCIISHSHTHLFMWGNFYYYTCGNLKLFHTNSCTFSHPSVTGLQHTLHAGQNSTLTHRPPHMAPLFVLPLGGRKIFPLYHSIYHT